MITAKLIKYGFQFKNKLPEDLVSVYKFLEKTTDGFNTTNEKLNLLDYNLWLAIYELNKNNPIIQKVKAEIDQEESKIINNGYATDTDKEYKAVEHGQMQLFERGGLLGGTSTGYPVIDEVLKQSKPYIEELVAKFKEYMKSNNKPCTERDVEYYRLGLIIPLINALGKYITKTDQIENIDFSKQKGVIVMTASIIRDGQKNYFASQMIVAGGYNIQVRHFRYIVDTKLPYIRVNTASQSHENKLNRMKKEDKLNEEINRLSHQITNLKSELADIERLNKEDVWLRSEYSKWSYKTNEDIEKTKEEAWRSHLRRIDSNNLRIKYYEKDLAKLKNKLSSLNDTEDKNDIVVSDKLNDEKNPYRIIELSQNKEQLMTYLKEYFKNNYYFRNVRLNIGKKEIGISMLYLGNNKQIRHHQYLYLTNELSLEQSKQKCIAKLKELNITEEQNESKFEEGGVLRVGDNTNLGVITDKTQTQYFINGTWYHKSLVKASEDVSTKTYTPQTINPNLIISAFANDINHEKLEKYTLLMEEKMLSHDFPPIKGFPSVIDENDVGQEFLNGETITDEHIGTKVWKVTDGHHRSLAAINAGLPYIRTELDYSTITDQKDLYEQGGWMEDANVDEKLKKQYISDIASLKGQIQYCEEQIKEIGDNPKDQWAAKEYRNLIIHHKEKIKELQRILKEYFNYDGILNDKIEKDHFKDGGKIREDRHGNFIGDGSFHAHYYIYDFPEYPQIKTQINKSETTESVYVTYWNDENKKEIKVRFSNHESNSVKFGDILDGYTTEKQEILCHLGLIDRIFIPNKYLHLEKRQVRKKDMELYEEGDLTIDELYKLGIGADLSKYKNKLAKDSNWLITGDSIYEMEQKRTNWLGLQETVGKYIYVDKNANLESGGEISVASEILLAPNGQPSNLTPKQWHLVRTPEFKAWFGDWETDQSNSSKIAYPDGSPKIVYHGTIHKITEFKQIETKRIIDGSLENINSQVHFFSESKEIADIFATDKQKLWLKENKQILKKRIYRVFLNIKKPLDFTINSNNLLDVIVSDCAGQYTRIGEINPCTALIFEEIMGYYPEDWVDIQIMLDNKNAINELKNRGFDGVILQEQISDDAVYVVFNSSQIKLADGSNTTFDPTNPDIRFDRGGLFEGRKKYAERKMADNALIETLTEEQHKALANLCAARHDFHSNMDTIAKVDSLGYKQNLINSNILLKESGLQPMSFVPTDESDFIDIDSIDDLIVMGERPDDQEEYNNWYENNYTRIYSELNALNNKIELYLKEVDAKYGTEYAPTGMSRFKKGGKINNKNYTNLINIPEEIKPVLEHLHKNNYIPLFIGGCVRDALMNIEPKDIDIEVYNIDYETLRNILDQYGITNLVGKEFGIIKFKSKGGLYEYDISIPRKENKVGIKHTDFKAYFDATMTVKEAATRRDFTFNALAYNPITNELHDYFGGVNDINNKIIRHTSEQFTEDALRILRAMQFQARFGFSVAPETYKLMRFIINTGEFNTISKERVSEEWMKWAIKGVDHSLIFDFIKESGLDKIYPDIAVLKFTKQDKIYHPEGDVAEHTKMCLKVIDQRIAQENITGDDKAVRVFSVLLHDIAKPDCTEEKEKNGRMTITSENHEFLGAEKAKEFLNSIGIKSAIIDKCEKLVGNHLAHLNFRNIPERSKVRFVRRLAARLYPATIQELYCVVEADHKGRYYKDADNFPFEIQDILDLSIEIGVNDKKPEYILKGRHLIDAGLKPSPLFKEILNEAQNAQDDQEFNDIDSAKKWLAEKLKNTDFTFKNGGNIYHSVGLEGYLVGKSRNPYIGKEVEMNSGDNNIRIFYTPDKTDYRFIYTIKNKNISVLHIDIAEGVYVIRNAFTLNNYKRQGFARQLYLKAKKILGNLYWSRNLSPEGKAFMQGMSKKESGGEISVALKILLAPNGKPSNLTPEQWHLVRTPEFKAWFGDWENNPKNASKVVDDNGEPLVVYHASYETFNVFKYGQFGFHFGNILQAQNIYDFRLKTKNRAYIKPYFLNIGKLLNTIDFIVWDSFHMAKIFYEHNIIDEQEKNEIINKNYNDGNRKLISLLQEKGYGGIVYYNEFEGEGKSYIAFNPEQIKLADGSNLTFDPENPDIRYSSGGEIFRLWNDIYDIDKAYKMINSGHVMYQIKEIEPMQLSTSRFVMCDKQYAEKLKPDYEKPIGLMIKHKSGNDLLIDGRHRIHKAFIDNVKKIKVYYIENPKTIAKFTKKPNAKLKDGGSIPDLKITTETKTENKKSYSKYGVSNYTESVQYIIFGDYFCMTKGGFIAALFNKQKIDGTLFNKLQRNDLTERYAQELYDQNKDVFADVLSGYYAHGGIIPSSQYKETIEILKMVLEDTDDENEKVVLLENIQECQRLLDKQLHHGFVKDDWIFHRKFGKGLVTDVNQDMLTVKFDDVTKRLIYSDLIVRYIEPKDIPYKAAEDIIDEKLNEELRQEFSEEEAPELIVEKDNDDDQDIDEEEVPVVKAESKQSKNNFSHFDDFVIKG